MKIRLANKIIKQCTYISRNLSQLLSKKSLKNETYWGRMLNKPNRDHRIIKAICLTSKKKRL